MDLTNFKLDLICDISYLNEQFSSLEMIPFDEKEKERLHEAAISNNVGFGKMGQREKTFFLGRRRCQFLKFPPSFFLSSF